MRGRNWLIVSGVVYDLTPEIAEGLFSCYQNLQREHGGRRVRRKAVREALEDHGRRVARRETRSVIPGICRDAKRLGVSRMHLWAVLTGRRESNGLMQRYTTLKKQEGEAK